MLSIPVQSKQWIKQVEKPQSISDENLHKLFRSTTLQQRKHWTEILVIRKERVENEMQRKFIK